MARFDVLTAGLKKSYVLWDMTPCRLVCKYSLLLLSRQMNANYTRITRNTLSTPILFAKCKVFVLNWTSWMDDCTISQGLCHHFNIYYKSKK